MLSGWNISMSLYNGRCSQYNKNVFFDNYIYGLNFIMIPRNPVLKKSLTTASNLNFIIFFLERDNRILNTNFVFSFLLEKI